MPFAFSACLPVSGNWIYYDPVLVRTSIAKADLYKFIDIPPQTGQPFNDPPWAARGSSIVLKKGGTLKSKDDSITWNNLLVNRPTFVQLPLTSTSGLAASVRAYSY